MCAATSSTRQDDIVANLHHNDEEGDPDNSNDDWCATSVIYGGNVSTKRFSDGSFYGIIEIPISVANVVFARRISDDRMTHKPSFRYWIAPKEATPIVRLCFV